jgi:hypothetical protein
MRHKLLGEVAIFLQDAIRIPGITRIALIASLTTGKADPKDVDILVTVQKAPIWTDWRPGVANCLVMLRILGAAARCSWPMSETTIWDASAPGNSAGREFAYLVMRWPKCLRAHHMLKTGMSKPNTPNRSP